MADRGGGRWRGQTQISTSGLPAGRRASSSRSWGDWRYPLPGRGVSLRLLPTARTLWGRRTYQGRSTPAPATPNDADPDDADRLPTEDLWGDILRACWPLPISVYKLY